MQTNLSIQCRLCHQEAQYFWEGRLGKYFQCNPCDSVLLDKLPDANAEKKRYDEHNNSLEDKGYINFLQPLANLIQKFRKPLEKGLDFGCGPVSVFQYLLEPLGFTIQKYDPFYFPEKSFLEQKYDFVIATEVAEHFHSPKIEFERLKKMLKIGGNLFLMTNLLTPEIQFENWYYKNDFTHVHFYTPDTMKWIADNFEMEIIEIQSRIVVFSNLWNLKSNY